MKNSVVEGWRLGGLRRPVHAIRRAAVRKELLP